MILKNALLAVFVGALTVGAVAPVNAETGLRGNINGLLGVKMLDDDDWDPVEDQFMLGVQSDFRRESWPVSIAVDLIGSGKTEEENDVDLKGSTFELGLGVRKNFESDAKLTPFVGGGLAIVSAEQEASVDVGGGTFTIDDDDKGVGLWVGGGLLFHLNERLNLGFNLRYSMADVELFDQDVDAGGLSLGLLGGVRF